MRKLVKDVMTRKIVTVPADAPVDVAISLMLEENVSGIPVVEDQGDLAGLITEFDVLQLYNNGHQHDFASCRQFMTTEVKTIQQDAQVATAAKIFKAASLRRLVVVEGNRPVGILSRRDVLRCICELRTPVAAVN